jgi:CheY-like chemotaxis protein
VLIVDDDDDLREAFAVRLSASGYDVRSADSAPKAMVIALEWHPAAVVIDVGLRGMDGYELSRRLRASVLASVKLVAFTGYSREKDRNMALEAGFDAYVVKGRDDLRASLSVLLGS